MKLCVTLVDRRVSDDHLTVWRPRFYEGRHGWTSHAIALFGAMLRGYRAAR